MTNFIAENLYSQIDSERKQFLVLEEISDHQKDGTALGAADKYTLVHNRNRTPKKTTCGWKLCVKMKEAFTKWIPLKYLKESNPVDLAEYAVSKNIYHEPAYSWWVPYTLTKRNRIISKLQRKYWRKNHKLGIEVPKSIKRAYEIDEETHTDFWRKATAK